MKAKSNKATVYYAPGDVRVETVPDPTIQQPTDAIVILFDHPNQKPPHISARGLLV